MAVLTVQSALCRIHEISFESGLLLAVAKREGGPPKYREGIDPVVSFCVDEKAGPKPNSRQTLIPVRPDLLREAVGKIRGKITLDALGQFFKSHRGMLPKNVEISGVTLFANEFDPPMDKAKFWLDSDGIGVDFTLADPNDTASRIAWAYERGYLQDAPHKRHPEWPDQRPLCRYNQLIQANQSKEPTLEQLLWKGGIWFDIGGGRGAAVRELRMRNVERAIVGIHHYPQLDSFGENFKRSKFSFDSMCPPAVKDFTFYAEMPENILPWGIFLKRVNVATDIYGALSYYYADPLGCLIQEAGLLHDSKSVLFAITEVNRFGTPETWRNIQEYFTSYSGQIVNFDTFWSPRDSDGKMEEALRIRIQGEGRYEPPFPLGNSLKAPAHFEIAARMARDYVGRPYVGEAIWPPCSQSRWTIRSVDYH